MYCEKDREKLFLKTVKFMKNEDEFEGLLQIGSGAVDYTDIYSDIDLMAGCFFEKDIVPAKKKLINFFESVGAIYIDERAWNKTVLGLSIYFENGLSMDISFMPTDEITIHSEKWKNVFAKTKKFADTVEKTAEEGKKLHQFKAFNTLEPEFVEKLEGTYPK